MKLLFTLLLLSLVYVSAFGQNKKYFLDVQNEICDSSKAASYMILFEKKQSDSVFKMNQFSIEDILLTSASFKDSALSIPHGKFEYYSLIRNNVSGRDVLKNIIPVKPIGSFLESEGHYSSGKKSGIWTEYDSEGRVKTIETYVDDVLNGDYAQYDINNNVIVRGEYINNLREGRWVVFGGSQDDIYKNGKVIKVIKNKEVLAEREKKQKEVMLLNREKDKYNRPPKEPAGFNSEISKFMGIANTNDIKFETAVVTFKIDVNGTISEPYVRGVSDFSLAEKIKEYFKQSTGWKAATVGKEKTPVVSLFQYRLNYR